MPYTMKRVKGGWRVINTASGKIKAKRTTKAKAKAQLRLLRGIEHGMIPRNRRR
jgi:hypothetical protein